ncbi:putative secreted protein with PEP-CTERM sorting signal [Pseudoduganella lurida]|uniref:Putative secreted protein with PEP-CTERM sorting signal n=2 Tax=Pseudoduganella lurida TaxID=1036180 RepID=A0A562RJJ4_9BURK|nr:putative secreted protein with PEP-CTERM sorting signal [Pseudoduganella lurida]
MSLLLATAALTAASIVPACSWNEPGRHPYRGTPAEAVSRYIDIPPATRQRLVEKIVRGAADDRVVITRDDILGRQTYAPQITAMHFGRQTVCEQVTRERWAVTARQPAAVYCADGECLIVPKICGNVSRVHAIAAGGGTGGRAATGGSMTGRTMPAHAPEVDVDAADAMAQLATMPAARTATGSMESTGYAPFGAFGGSGGSDDTPQPPRTAYGPAMPVLAPYGPVVGGTVSPVPEPAIWLLLLVGMGALGLYTRLR